MNNSSKKYDIVIVGAGLGGLFTGALLAKEGKKVCVLEKNFQIGGNLQVFNRKGCSFSAGMHYAGSLDKGQILYKIFKYLNIYDKIDIYKLDKDEYEKIIIGDKEYSYAMGMDNFRNNLLRFFPSEKKAIDTYVNKIEEIWNTSVFLNLRGFPTDIKYYLTDSYGSVYKFIDSLTKNKELKALLAATNSLYAGNKEKASLYIHAVIMVFYINSAWRIADKGRNIAVLLKQIIEENNGIVLNKKEVTGFNFENENIRSAIVNNSEEYAADLFISGIHPAVTIDMIESKQLRKAYIHRIKSLENSISPFVLFIVLNKKRIKHINSNIYYSTTNDVWGIYDYTPENWPKGYMMYTSEDHSNKGYAESVVIISMMKFEEVKGWENTTVENRGEKYERFKTKKSEQLLNTVYIKFPELKNAIDTVYSATPLTYRDYTNIPQGSMYGVVKDYNNPLKTFISHKTKIPNLLLTGQNIGIHGMLGVIMSGFQTCSSIIDINKVINDIRKY